MTRTEPLSPVERLCSAELVANLHRGHRGSAASLAKSPAQDPSVPDYVRARAAQRLARWSANTSHRSSNAARRPELGPLGHPSVSATSKRSGGIESGHPVLKSWRILHKIHCRVRPPGQRAHVRRQRRGHCTAATSPAFSGQASFINEAPDSFGGTATIASSATAGSYPVTGPTRSVELLERPGRGRGVRRSGRSDTGDTRCGDRPVQLIPRQRVVGRGVRHTFAALDVASAQLPTGSATATASAEPVPCLLAPLAVVQEAITGQSTATTLSGISSRRSPR